MLIHCLSQRNSGKDAMGYMHALVAHLTQGCSVSGWGSEAYVLLT